MGEERGVECFVPVVRRGGFRGIAGGATGAAACAVGAAIGGLGCVKGGEVGGGPMFVLGGTEGS